MFLAVFMDRSGVGFHGQIAIASCRLLPDRVVFTVVTYLIGCVTDAIGHRQIDCTGRCGVLIGIVSIMGEAVRGIDIDIDDVRLFVVTIDVNVLGQGIRHLC